MNSNLRSLILNPSIRSAFVQRSVAPSAPPFHGIATGDSRTKIEDGGLKIED
jgi:hypothetical protein